MRFVRVSAPASACCCLKTAGCAFEFDDDGPGIPPELQAHVLQPFVRLESSRNRDTGGVGLGLYIAREISARLGGELRLRNREPSGLRAELWRA